MIGDGSVGMNLQDLRSQEKKKFKSTKRASMWMPDTCQHDEHDVVII